MRGRVIGGLLVVAVLAVSRPPQPARGQDAVRAVPAPAVAPDARTGLNPAYAVPGNYGMMFGTASYGSVRTYSEFSSPYGPGYRYGYAPASFLPGPYGLGLWRPGSPNAYGPAPYAYRTFPIPYDPTLRTPTPPIGLYAPGFGPPSFPTR
jgi:hypothetical protein